MKEIEAKMVLYKITVDGTDSNAYVKIMQNISQNPSKPEKVVELNPIPQLSGLLSISTPITQRSTSS